MIDIKENRRELFDLLKGNVASPERSEAIFNSLGGVLSNEETIPDGTKHSEVVVAVAALAATVIYYSNKKNPMGLDEHLEQFVNMLQMTLMEEEEDL